MEYNENEHILMRKKAVEYVCVRIRKWVSGSGYLRLRCLWQIK